jgi:hypothetical protein
VRCRQFEEGIEVEMLNRDGVLRALVAYVPSPFWLTLAARVRQTYRDCFEQALHNPQIDTNQRLDWLLQHRHFCMEKVLSTVSSDHGMPVSSSLVVANNRRYMLVGCGPMLFTQAYVATLADVPHPARFREHHSRMNAVSANQQLRLGDQPEELLEKKDFYGIITHNPIGRRFTETDQSLSMIQFSVPEIGCSDWVAQLTFQEVIDAYGRADKKEAPRRDRDAPWKESEKKKDEGDE